MFSGNRLKAIRQENELTQENLGKLIGVGKVTISKWESGQTVPNAKHLQKLEETFLVESDYFDELFDISKSFRRLHSENQEKVVHFSNELLQSQGNLIHLYQYQIRDEIRLSAGRGEAVGNEYESRTVYSDKLYDYDVATWIRGNSMSPNYESGEVALIRETGYDYEGAVYAVVWNDETYIKKVFKEKGGLRLVSINKDYQDMFAPFDEEPIVVGRVVGHFFPMEAA